MKQIATITTVAATSSSNPPQKKKKVINTETVQALSYKQFLQQQNGDKKLTPMSLLVKGIKKIDFEQLKV